MLDDLFKTVDYLRKGMPGFNYDHFTLMRFSTHWKAVFDTPDLDSGKGREYVRNLPTFKTPEEAIIWAIGRKVESFLI